MCDVYDDTIEYVFNACQCGNTDPSKYAPVGYRDWSRANGVPMVPVFLMCLKCRRNVSFRTEKIKED